MNPGGIIRFLRKAGQARIGVRLSGCFVLIVVLMLLGDGLALWQFRSIGREVRRLAQVDQQQLAVRQVDTDVLALQSSLEPFIAARDAGKFMAAAGQLGRSFTEDAVRAQQSLSSSDSFEGPNSMPAISLESVRRILPTQIATLRDLAAAGDWIALQRRFDNQVSLLRSITTAAVAEVDRQVAEQRTEALNSVQDLQRRLVLLLPVAALLTLLAAGVLGFLVTRSITRPLAQLDAGARALARGEFAHQVTVSGVDELATLGVAFNFAAAQLRDSYAAITRSEYGFRSLIEHSSDFIATLNPDGVVRYASPSAERVLGFKPGELEGKTIFDSVHPGDIAGVREALDGRTPHASQSIEFRFRHADGSTRTLEAVVSNPLVYAAAAAVVLNARDITDRTRAEKEIVALNERLINAYEEERARIARELHDDFSQRIAALSISASTLKQHFSHEKREIVEQFERLQQRLIDLAAGVRQLSHQLHPAMLEHAGLGPALRSYCAEFSSLSRLNVRCCATDDFSALSPPAALCIYRVTQEALQNAAKHAQVTEVEVRLTASDGMVSLSISDEGAGCRSSDVRGGLGLVSMQERTRLVNGVFEFKSEPRRGTTVRVSIPVASSPATA